MNDVEAMEDRVAAVWSYLDEHQRRIVAASEALASITTDDHRSTRRAGIPVSHDENAWCLPLYG